MRNVAVAVLTLVSLAWAEEAREVRVAVSLDREHSARVLSEFEKETGIKVVAAYDTEATKTVGMVRKILGEKADPQTDVYWNNELATTIKLKENGVLEVFRPKAADDIPNEFKDPEGFWTGFAARARVLIVNTDLVPEDERPTSMWDLTNPRWKGRICMARPETGTTAAHASALYTIDEAKADEYFDKLVANECGWLTGNAHCMREVSAGAFAFGWTDTDDFNVALGKGAPVAQVFPDRGDGQIGVMYIPNSLMLIKGAPHPEEGKQLIEWLLSPRIEEQLAHSRTAQIPVRPGVKVPDNVRRPDQVGKVMALEWDRVGKEYDQWVARAIGRLDAVAQPATTLYWILGGVVVAALILVVALKRATGEPT